MDTRLSGFVGQLETAYHKLRTEPASNEQISRINKLLEDISESKASFTQEDASTIRALNRVLSDISSDSSIPLQTKNKISSVSSTILVSGTADWTKYYDIQSNIEDGTLMDKMKRADVVFLPESHDNEYDRKAHGKAVHHIHDSIGSAFTVITEDGSKPGHGQLAYVDPADCSQVIMWGKAGQAGIDAFNEYGTMTIHLNQALTSYLEKCIKGNLEGFKFVESLDDIISKINIGILIFKADPEFYDQAKSIVTNLQAKIEKLEKFDLNECVELVSDIRTLLAEIEALSFESVNKINHLDQVERQNLLFQAVETLSKQDQKAVLIGGGRHLLVGLESKGEKGKILAEKNEGVRELFRKINDSNIKFVMLVPKDKMDGGLSGLFQGLGPLIVEEGPTAKNRAPQTQTMAGLDELIEETKSSLENKTKNIISTTDYIDINHKYDLLLGNLIKKYRQRLEDNQSGCVIS